MSPLNTSAPELPPSSKFGLPETAITKRTCIVIVEVDLEEQRTVMGVMADSVSQVIDLGPEDVARTAATAWWMMPEPRCPHSGCA